MESMLLRLGRTLKIRTGCRKDKTMAVFNAQEFKQAAVFASKDKYRPILCAVLVEIEGDDYRLVATDSYRLIAFEKGCPSEKKAASYIVKASEASSVRASDVSIEIIKFEKDANLLEVRITDKNRKARTEYWSTVEGKYANWRQLIPDSFEDEGSTFGLNPMYLKDACSVIGKIYDKKTPIKMFPTKPGKAVYFEASEKDKSRCFGLIMPVRTEKVDEYLKKQKAAEKKKSEAPKEALKEEHFVVVHVEDDIKTGYVSQLPEDKRKQLLQDAYCSLLMNGLELEDAIMEVAEKVANSKVADLGELIDVSEYAA